MTYLDNVDGNGGYTTLGLETKNQLIHLGCFLLILGIGVLIFLILHNRTDLSYYEVDAFKFQMR